MSAYFITTYDIANADEYAKYNPGSLPVLVQTLARHGGEILVAGHECVPLVGADRDVKIVLKFPDREAAQAWYDDPDYAPVKAIRLNSTSHISSFIIDGFVLPTT
jgi:uncharacterized protein (DUF1330 family)